MARLGTIRLWFKAALVEEGTQARLKNLTGPQLALARRTGPAAAAPADIEHQRLPGH